MISQFEVQQHRLAVTQAEATARLLRAVLDLTRAVQDLTKLLAEIKNEMVVYENKNKKDDTDDITRTKVFYP